MKYLIFLFVLLPLAASTQEAYSFATTGKNHNFLALDVDHMIALAGWSSTCRVPTLELRHTQTGQQLFNGIYATSQFGDFTDVCWLNHQAWAVGRLVISDDVWSSPKSVLAAYSWEGALLFSHEVADELAWEGRPSIHPLPGGGALWNTGHKLYRVSGEGAFLDTINWGTAIAHVGVIAEDVYLVQLEGEDELEIIDLSGNTLEEIFSEAGIKSVASNETLAYVLTEDKIYGIDLQNGQTQTHALGANHSYNKLAIEGEKAILYTTGSDSSDFGRYSFEENEFTFIGKWELPGREIQELMYQSGRFYLAGTDYFSGSAAFSSGLSNGFVQSFSAPEAQSLGPDLGVAEVELSFDSVRVSYNAEFGFHTIRYNATARVEVRNHGPTPFNDMYILASDRTGGFNCSDIRHYELQEGQIAAGAAIWQEFSIQDVEVHGGPPPAELAYHNNLIQCYFTGAPSFMPDANALNNRACDTLTIAGTITETNAPFPEEVLVNLYPNPAGNWLVVEYTNVEVVKAHLLNARGQVVEVPVEAGLKRLRFNLQGLSRGMYVLSIISKKGQIVKRVVVQ
jgi:hypothetical protein